MAEFTVTADKFHVHVSDGRRTADYEIEVRTEEEAVAIARSMWARREEAKIEEEKVPAKKAAAKAAA